MAPTKITAQETSTQHRGKYTSNPGIVCTTRTAQQYVPLLLLEPPPLSFLEIYHMNYVHPMTLRVV
jgi:hypothetical protein